MIKNSVESKLNRKKGIIFDLFHTLGSLSHSKTPGIHTSQRLGIDRDIWDEALFSRTEARLKGNITDPVDIIYDICNKVDATIAHDLIKDAAEARIKRFAYAHSHVLPHILNTLKYLSDKGYKLALLSNADKIEKSGWQDAPISKYFQTTIFSCDVGYCKPQKEIYTLCLQGLNMEAQDCVFVGDGGSSEFSGSKKSGLFTIFTSEFIKDRWPEKIQERINISDHHIGNISELKNLFDGKINAS